VSKKHGIQVNNAFPTLNLYSKGEKVTEYRGDKLLDALKTFLLKHKLERGNKAEL